MESQNMLESSMKKRKRFHNNRTSNNTNNLGNDVLENVFSFLPVKSVMKIGALSHRFHDSWKLCRSLDFSKGFVRRLNQHQFIRIAHRILEFHKGPKVDNLRLFFDSNYNRVIVEDLIRFATMKGVEEMDLEFVPSYTPFRFPIQFLNCDSLKVLKLSFCQLDIPITFSGLKSVTTLVLKRIFINEDLIMIMLRNCVLLEELDLIDCPNHCNLLIRAPNLSRFKVLKMLHCNNYYSIRSIDLDAPTLSSFQYCGYFDQFTLSGNILKLEDVMLSVPPVNGFEVPSHVKYLLWSLSHIKVLTINSTFLEGLKRAQVCMRNLKEFQLRMEPTSYCNPFDIALFLVCCPNLERLFIDLTGHSFECGLFWEMHDMEQFENLSFLFRHLKYVKLTGFKLQTLDLLLANLFLQKAIALENLVLEIPKNHHPKLNVEDKCDAILLSWRASPYAKVVVLEHSKDSATSLHPTHNHNWRNC